MEKPCFIILDKKKVRYFVIKQSFISSFLLVIFKRRLNPQGDQGFSVAAPERCNELALEIKPQHESCVTSALLSFILILFLGLSYYVYILLHFSERLCLVCKSPSSTVVNSLETCCINKVNWIGLGWIPRPQIWPDIINCFEESLISVSIRKERPIKAEKCGWDRRDSGH